MGASSPIRLRKTQELAPMGHSYGPDFLRRRLSRDQGS